MRTRKKPCVKIIKGHWEYTKDFNPDDYYGFIYRITFLLTGEKYIGKKAFHTWNRTGTKKTGKSKWETYTSSSKELNTLIKDYSIDWFHFEILTLCCTKSCWSYSENNIMHKLDVLTEVDPVWGMRVYLNRAINKTQWVPKFCESIYVINQLADEKPKQQEKSCPGR
jgi:hypothetical protein